MNRAAQQLGRLAKGIKKTMSEAAINQRREASKQPRKKKIKKSA